MLLSHLELSSILNPDLLVSVLPQFFGLVLCVVCATRPLDDGKTQDFHMLDKCSTIELYNHCKNTFFVRTGDWTQNLVHARTSTITELHPQFHSSFIYVSLCHWI